MNFLSNRQGFYEQAGSKGMRSLPHQSSSSSSSSVLPLAYSYQQQRGSWLPESSSNQDENAAALRVYEAEGEYINEDDAGNEHLTVGRGSGAAAAENNNNTVGSCTGGMMVIEKEHMFDKVVTPSDVGKLNRLVIPKQHAEKYFPLDSSANEKGLLLNFEDRNGKPWRFRYSYWNSSQSYVMTKGWSRFVKEKKLDAGDIVSFQRGAGESGKDRLFIDWRRRPEAADHHHQLGSLSHLPHNFSFHRSISAPPSWNHPLFLQQRDHSHLLPAPHQFQSNYPNNNTHSYAGYGNVPPSVYNSNFNTTTHVVNGNPCPAGSVIYLSSGGTGVAMAAGPRQLGGMVQLQRGGGAEPVVFDSVPVVQGKAAAKRFRLFGVNMECPISETDECDILSSTSMSNSSLAMQPQSSSPFNSSVQLRLSHGSPFQTMPPPELPDDKGKGSMSLDLDI